MRPGGRLPPARARASCSVAQRLQAGEGSGLASPLRATLAVPRPLSFAGVSGRPPVRFHTLARETDGAFARSRTHRVSRVAPRRRWANAHSTWRRRTRSRTCRPTFASGAWDRWRSYPARHVSAPLQLASVQCPSWRASPRTPSAPWVAGWLGGISEAASGHCRGCAPLPVRKTLAYCPGARVRTFTAV